MYLIWAFVWAWAQIFYCIFIVVTSVFWWPQVYKIFASESKIKKEAKKTGATKEYLALVAQQHSDQLLALLRKSKETSDKILFYGSSLLFFAFIAFAFYYEYFM